MVEAASRGTECKATRFGAGAGGRAGRELQAELAVTGKTAESGQAPAVKPVPAGGQNPGRPVEICPEQLDPWLRHLLRPGES